MGCRGRNLQEGRKKNKAQCPRTSGVNVAEGWKKYVTAVNSGQGKFGEGGKKKVVVIRTDRGAKGAGDFFPKQTSHEEPRGVG